MKRARRTVRRATKKRFSIVDVTVITTVLLVMTWIHGAPWWAMVLLTAGAYAILQYTVELATALVLHKPKQPQENK